MIEGRRAIFILLIASCVESGCAPSDTRPPGSHIQIEYSGNCLVSCGFYTLEISDVGVVKFTPVDDVAENRFRPKRKLSERDITKLLALIQESDFFQLEEQRHCEFLIEDEVSFTYTVSTEQERRSLTRHYGCTDLSRDAVYSLFEETAKLVSLQR